MITSLPQNADMHISTVHRMGQAQRTIESIFADTPPQNKPEIVSVVLKVSIQYFLPIKAFDYMESWAVKTYWGEQ